MTKTPYDIAVERLIAETDMDALRRDMANARALLRAANDMEDLATLLLINDKTCRTSKDERMMLFDAAGACRSRARQQINAAPNLLVTTWGEVTA